MKLLKRFIRPNITKLEEQGRADDLAAIVASDTKDELRLEAISALSRIGHPQATMPLVGALGDPDESVARGAETGLASLGTAAADALVEALGGPGADASRRLLVNLEGDAIECLRSGCGHQNETVRRLALEGLIQLDGKLDDASVREILFRVLLAALGDRSPRCRVLAARNLENLGDPKAGRALAAQLKDGDEGVRAACRQTLLTLGESTSPYLLDALADRNANSRRLAAELLGEVCSGDIDRDRRRDALAALAERAKDGDPEVAAAVGNALEKIPTEAVIATQLERLLDPERSDHEEIRDFLVSMLKHAELSPKVEARIAERMNTHE